MRTDAVSLGGRGPGELWLREPGDEPAGACSQGWKRSRCRPVCGTQSSPGDPPVLLSGEPCPCVTGGYDSQAERELSPALGESPGSGGLVSCAPELYQGRTADYLAKKEEIL